jgi:hypothetical protein
VVVAESAKLRNRILSLLLREEDHFRIELETLKERSSSFGAESGKHYLFFWRLVSGMGSPSDTPEG